MIKATLIIGLITLCGFGVFYQRDKLEGIVELDRMLAHYEEVIRADQRIQSLEDAYQACRKVG